MFFGVNLTQKITFNVTKILLKFVQIIMQKNNQNFS